MKFLSILKFPTLLSLTLVTLAVALTGCSNATPPEVVTQVAAKVGSEEISMHQINAVLAKDNSSGATADQLQVRSRAVLEGLIDQQLAIEEAIATKLSRTPEVVAQIEAARRDVLATAYVKQFVAGLPKPDPQVVLKYFNDHPALFAERRIFQLQEVVAESSAHGLTELNRLAANQVSVEEVVQWLKANKIAFTTGHASRSAEQIPMDLLPRMQLLQDGQDAVFPSARAITFVRLISSQKAAVSEQDALPRIAIFLSHQQSTEAVANQLKTLRGQSKVTYEGAFSTPADAPAPLEAGMPSDAVAPDVGQIGPANSTLEKGVAGLK